MSTNYSCFFITPIGKDGSNIRRNADLVLSLIVQPALVQSGFVRSAIIRSDLVPDSEESITSRIEYHIKHANLCVVDLTGLNPNVMYELGFRKGVGLPVIRIASEEMRGRLPFDLTVEDVVFYDFSRLDNLPDVLRIIEQHVNSLKEKGLLDNKKTVTEENIFKRLENIEQKLDFFIDAKSVLMDDSDEVDLSHDDPFEINDPAKAFIYYLSIRDLVHAENLMPRLETLLEKKEFLRTVAQLAAIGSVRGALTLKRQWEYVCQNMELEDQIRFIGAYVGYCNLRDQESKESDFVNAELNRLLDISVKEENKAILWNQKSRMCYGLYTTEKDDSQMKEKFLDQAIEALEQAIALDAREAAYQYNLACCYMAKEDVSSACGAVERCIELGSNDYDHLVMAYKIFKQMGDKKKQNEMDVKISFIDRKRWSKERKLIDMEDLSVN